MENGGNHPGPSAEGDSPKVPPAPVQRLERHVWRRILAGLLVLIPLLITLLVLRFVIVFVDGFIRPLPFVDGKIYDFPGIGLFVGLVFLYFIGALVASRLGHNFVRWQLALLEQVPIVKNIYGVAKQATDALSRPMGHRFSRVVFIEWPRGGVLAMGFVTGHCHSPVGDGTLLVVYIPTVPNPTSGNLAFIPEDDIVESNFTVEEAMKVVFSGGIVLPDELSIAAKPDLLGPPRP